MSSRRPKHHDGLCLWDTATTSFSTLTGGPRRNLLDEFARGVRSAGLRFGVYFSGGLDWHESAFGPITSNEELFAHRRNDVSFAQFVADQLDELIDDYAPDVLWNDIDWPDAGKSAAPYGLAALFERYFAKVPDGVVNDRWGVPFHGHLTREYLPTAADDRPWEATRGIGRSFGYNAAEPAEHRLTGTELIRLLVRTVAAGGNLLVNTGLTAAGEVPDEQASVLDQLGAWMGHHGDAIHDTRPWRPELAGGPVVATRDDAGINLFVLDPDGTVELPAGLPDGILRFADGRPAEPEGRLLRLRPTASDQPVAVLRLTDAAGLAPTPAEVSR